MRDFILSDEVLARKKLATENATKAKLVPILVTKTGDTQEYDSITQASEALNVTKGAVSQALSNNRLIKKTYIIKSITSENG